MRTNRCLIIWMLRVNLTHLWCLTRGIILITTMANKYSRQSSFVLFPAASKNEHDEQLNLCTFESEITTPIQNKVGETLFRLYIYEQCVSDSWYTLTTLSRTPARSPDSTQSGHEVLQLQSGSLSLSPPAPRTASQQVSCTSWAARAPATRGHGLWASHPSAQAGGARRGRVVQEHRPAAPPAWTPPTREDKFCLRRKKTTQVRFSLSSSFSLFRALNKEG